jgi:acetyl-CoA carboxylase biotin carboxyl carrier protein
VADDLSKSSAPFDIKTIGALVSLMSEHDLSEIDLHDGGQRIRLRRGVAVSALPAPQALFQPAPVMSAPKNDAPANAAAPAPAAKKNLKEIKSPVVGTFYASPDPNSPAYVTVGSKVTPTTTVCIIEAMKIFNEIAAECAGTIAEVCVENQQPVEYGQVLFRVDPG